MFLFIVQSEFHQIFTLLYQELSLSRLHEHNRASACNLSLHFTLLCARVNFYAHCSRKKGKAATTIRRKRTSDPCASFQVEQCAGTFSAQRFVATYDFLIRESLIFPVWGWETSSELNRKEIVLLWLWTRMGVQLPHNRISLQDDIKAKLPLTWRGSLEVDKLSPLFSALNQSLQPKFNFTVCSTNASCMFLSSRACFCLEHKLIPFRRA